MNYQSFAITFRPRDGVTDKQIKKMEEYCRKKCDYYYLITEKEGTDRHIHVGMFLKKKMLKGSVAIELLRMYPELDSDERRVARKGIKIQYNLDWIEKYLDKDDATTVISDNLPERAHLDAYWPPDEDQRKAQAAKSVDSFYAKLEMLWYEHRSPGVEKSRENVRDFLADMMYCSRKIRVMDRKKHLSVALCLTDYLNKCTALPNVQWAPFEH